MKETRILMGMPVTVEITDARATRETIDKVFSYFRYIDEKFSTYKEGSEISGINSGRLREKDWSDDMRVVWALCEETKKETGGYFDIRSGGKYDPSGLVKGWSIYNAARLLEEDGFKNFYVDAGGDIQAQGQNGSGEKWKIGIRDPFGEGKKIVKVLHISGEGVATSGNYIRGQHIYNPKDIGRPITDIVSLTVIGPNVYEADRFATAAFAMGKRGVFFIENSAGFEGYMIDKDGIGTETSGFFKYTKGI